MERGWRVEVAAGRALLRSASLAQASRDVLAAIGESIEWEMGALWRLDRPAGVLHCLETWQRRYGKVPGFEALTRRTVLTSGIGLPGRVWATGQPAWVTDVTKDVNFPRAEGADGEGLHGALCVPLMSRGALFGAMEFFSQEIQPPDEELLAMMTELGGQIGECLTRLQAESELRESEARKSAILQSALDCFVSIDHQGLITEFNATAERTFGWRREQVIGRQIAETLIPHALRGRHLAGIKRYLATGKSDILGQRFEMTALRADGTEFPVELAINRIDGEGPPTFMASLRDLTRRRSLEDQLRVSQKIEAVGRLAGGMAHDFNNMLTAISGFAEMIHRRVGPGNPAAGEARQIQRAAERGASLIRQLLAFGRKQVLQPVILDINLGVADVEKMLRRLIREDIELSIELAPEPGRVLADPGQIEQLILNLALNARDAMPEGGRLVITTSLVELDAAYASGHLSVQPGSYVKLEVTDSGCGMDTETLSHIFEPFFTTKEESKGTGLGLATVHGIVSQSGGNIWVYSEPGVGSSFKVYLPRVMAAEETKPESPDPPEAALGSETILIVEDEEMVRQIMQHTLEADGYSVLTAACGLDALAIFEREPDSIQLVLTDVVMPGMTGREVAERIQSARPGIKVLFVSGYEQSILATRGVLSEDTAFIQKPFTLQGLARKVREVLEGGPVKIPSAAAGQVA